MRITLEMWVLHNNQFLRSAEMRFHQPGKQVYHNRLRMLCFALGRIILRINLDLHMPVGGSCSALVNVSSPSVSTDVHFY